MTSRRDPRSNPIGGDVLRLANGKERHVNCVREGMVTYRSLGGRLPTRNTCGLPAWRRWGAEASVVRRGD